MTRGKLELEYPHTNISAIIFHTYSFPPSTRWNWTAAVVAVVARAREAPAKTLIGARENDDDDDETPEAEWSRAPFGARTAGSETGVAAADDTESGTGSAERSQNDAA